MAIKIRLWCDSGARKLNNMDASLLSVKSGDILTFNVIEWFHEGYEFGRPCLMLSPVIREDSDSNPESMIEDVCIDLSLGYKISKNNQQDQINWRGWNLNYLRRVFREVLCGKKIATYKATQEKVEFEENIKGELDFKHVK